MKRRYNSVEKFTELALSQASDTDSQPFNPSRRKSHENLIVPPPTSNLHILLPQQSTYSYSTKPAATITFLDPRGRNQPPRVPLYNSPNTANRQIQSSRSRPYPPNTNSHLAQRAAESVASTNRTQKSYDKLADVYSASSDSFQFADNLRAFFDNNVPGFVWTVFSVLQIVAGLVSIFVGTFNYPCATLNRKFLSTSFSLVLLLSSMDLSVYASKFRLQPLPPETKGSVCATFAVML
uniref:Uncharacterized protein n=1 Tax=Ditylenchus dipsaci TaxID=166011 RepID=A0A915EI12_9BILA